ncbi:hypothetical protein EXU57_19135 [Segetibacter sp. 3557_3]|uniref:hypothetical protein n=1 Tax=Segetibacter sp. 3557_3 TaxID=2547429 RepID=UPI001058B7DC|nr:hypothetical protein [Segetibacter sp. 3557_3]TDH21618.1 hypothetical protein EXU57_19135 [Segetibacter sp. 3557_3]
MKILISAFAMLAFISSSGQYAYTAVSPTESGVSVTPDYIHNFPAPLKRKTLYQRNVGVILGLQKGRYTAIELGGEAHWRKISILRKPHIIGATANMSYNFSNHVVGYHAGMWMKRGRINFTYGGNLSYFTDFKDGNRFGFGPAIGFRLLGFHLVNGYTFVTKDKKATTKTPMEVNKLYMSLRYYFPVENKFTWDRQTMKKKRERRREKEDRKEERQERRENNKGKGINGFFNNLFPPKKVRS